MNLPRARMRTAFAFMEGLGFGQGQLPFELFDAVALSDDEADAMRLDENAQRAVNEALAEAAKG